MNPIVAANLSVAAFNVFLTLCMWALMIARVPPPNVSGWSVAVCFVFLEITVWTGAFAYASA